MTEGRKSLRVYKSNTAIIAQLIDGEKTIIGERFVFKDGKNHIEEAREFGKEFGAKLETAKCSKIAFVRGKSIYHGRVKAFAEGLRDKKIEF